MQLAGVLRRSCARVGTLAAVPRSRCQQKLLVASAVRAVHSLNFTQAQCSCCSTHSAVAYRYPWPLHRCAPLSHIELAVTVMAPVVPNACQMN